MQLYVGRTYSPVLIVVGLFSRLLVQRSYRKMSTSSRKEREKKPLLLNDDEGGAPPPYVGVGEMDRPFGTSSMRYWALFVFVALSVTQNIVRACFFLTPTHGLFASLQCGSALTGAAKSNQGSLCSVYLLSMYRDS